MVVLPEHDSHRSRNDGTNPLAAKRLTLFKHGSKLRKNSFHNYSQAIMGIEEFLIGLADSRSVEKFDLANYKFTLKREFNVKNTGMPTKNNP